MAIDDYDDAPPSPFSRPGFLASAVLIALIVVAGLIISVANNDDGDSAAAPPPAGPADNPRAGDADSESVCGLDGEETGEARLTSPPDVDRWEYEGLVAYPVHEDYGPGETAKAGYRYCFQHTPEGAVYAAAYALAVGTERMPVPREWIEYFAGPGPYRDELVAPESASAASASDNPPGGTRMTIVGFRLLTYDGATARVDLGVEGATAGTPYTASVVYDLAWVDGDWKIDSRIAEPFDFAVIPDLGGYIELGSDEAAGK